MSKFVNNNNENEWKAIKEFTDRVEPRKVFWKTYEEKQSDKIDVITYYGMGGIGKSTLLRKLLSELKEKNSETRYAFVDFDKLNNYNNDILEILRYVEGNLKGKYKFSFPLFDLVSYTYEVKMGKNATKPELSSIFDENEELSFLTDVISEIPLIGTISKVICLSEKAKNLLQNRIESNKLKSKLGNIDNMEPADIYENLPYYFAIDLKDNVEKLELPFVFFIDTYEKLVNELENRNALEKDLFLRGENGLILNVPNTIWVIAGREKLKWEEHDKEWKGSIDQHLLGNLSLADTKYFLEKAGIKDQNLIDEIYDLTHGAPKYLDICVDTFTSLVNQNKVPTIADFGKNTTELQKRYLVYMDDAEKDFVTMLAFLSNWTDDNIEKISKEILGNFSYSLYEKVKGFSFIQKEGEEYSINTSFKDIIIANTNENLKNKYFKILEANIDKEIEEIILNDKKVDGNVEKVVNIDNYNSKKKFKTIILSEAKEIAKANNKEEFINKAKFIIKKIEEYENKYDDIIVIQDIEEYLRSKFEYSNTLEFKLLLGYKSLEILDIIDNYNMSNNTYHLKRYIERTENKVENTNLKTIIEKEFGKNSIHYIRTLILCGGEKEEINQLLENYIGEKDKLYVKTLLDSNGVAEIRDVKKLKEATEILSKEPEYLTTSMVKSICRVGWGIRKIEEREVILNYVYSVRYIINETLNLDIIDGFYNIVRGHLGGLGNIFSDEIEDTDLKTKDIEILTELKNRYEEIYGKDNDKYIEAETFLLKENIIYMPSIYSEIMDKYIKDYGYNDSRTKLVFKILTNEVKKKMKKSQGSNKTKLIESVFKYGTLMIDNNSEVIRENAILSVTIYVTLSSVVRYEENFEQKVVYTNRAYELLYKTLKYYRDNESELKNNWGYYYSFLEDRIDKFFKDIDNNFELVKNEIVGAVWWIIDNKYANKFLEKIIIKIFAISLYKDIENLFENVKQMWGQKNVEELMKSEKESSIENLEKKYASSGGSTRAYTHVILMYKLIREIVSNIDGLYEEYYDTVEKRKKEIYTAYKDFKYINKCSKLSKYLYEYKDAYKTFLNNDVRYYIWEYYAALLGVIYGTGSALYKFDDYKKLEKKFKNNKVLGTLNGIKERIVDIRKIDGKNKDWTIFA